MVRFASAESAIAAGRDDICIVVTPILPETGGILMTNSGKFAHCAPGMIGYSVVSGTLVDCVEIAVSGRLVLSSRKYCSGEMRSVSFPGTY